MPYTLKQASAATGRERTTLLRGSNPAALGHARRSYRLLDHEPSELHRVYPPAESTCADDGDAEARTPDALTEALAEIRELRARLEAAEDGIRLREDVIADLRQQRDQEATERRQAQAADRTAVQISATHSRNHSDAYGGCGGAGDEHSMCCRKTVIPASLAKRPMRPPNRPDFMYEKSYRIGEMCETYRLMGFQHMHAELSFVFCRLMYIRKSFRYFWPIIRRPDWEPLRRPGWVPLSRPS